MRVRLAALAYLALLVLPAIAQAGAGGGSSGFGGGGGGGGGFSGGGGGGYYGGGGGGGGVMFLFFIVLVLLFVLVSWINKQRIAAAYRRRRHKRARTVELAAAEATEDDAWFDPDAVRAETADLYRRVQQAWDSRDEAALAKHLGPDLLVEWRRRLADFERKRWHNRVEVVGDVEVEYLGLVNREDDDQDRVTVRVTATLRDYVVDRHGQHITRKGATSETTRQSEWWVCLRTSEGWRLESIEQDKEGQHLLEEQLVASPWSDDQQLRDEALVEGAQADAVPEGTSVAEVADLDFEGDARAAANDLSLADGRFAPDILEVAVRRATAAWAQAVDGDDAPLAAVARPEAIHALLYPNGGNSRLVVRGPRVAGMTVIALDAAAEPPTMTVRLELAGRRYVEDRDTLAKLSGSADRERTWRETWTLALDGEAANPWRIASTSDKGAPAGA